MEKTNGNPVKGLRLSRYCVKRIREILADTGKCDHISGSQKFINGFIERAVIDRIAKYDAEKKVSKSIEGCIYRSV